MQKISFFTIEKNVIIPQVPSSEFLTFIYLYMQSCWLTFATLFTHVRLLVRVLLPDVLVHVGHLHEAQAAEGTHVGLLALQVVGVINILSSPPLTIVKHAIDFFFGQITFEFWETFSKSP